MARHHVYCVQYRLCECVVNSWMAGTIQRIRDNEFKTFRIALDINWHCARITRDTTAMAALVSGRKMNYHPASVSTSDC